MKIPAGDLYKDDLFMWQDGLYRVIGPLDSWKIRVRRIASFWPNGRGGASPPTWVYTKTTGIEEPFQMDCEVEIVSFVPKRSEVTTA